MTQTTPMGTGGVPASDGAGAAHERLPGLVVVTGYLILTLSYMINAMDRQVFFPLADDVVVTAGQETIVPDVHAGAASLALTVTSNVGPLPDACWATIRPIVAAGTPSAPFRLVRVPATGTVTVDGMEPGAYQVQVSTPDTDAPWNVGRLTPTKPTFSPPTSTTRVASAPATAPFRLAAKRLAPVSARSLASSGSPSAQSFTPRAHATSPKSLSERAMASALNKAWVRPSAGTVGSANNMGPAPTTSEAPA